MKIEISYDYNDDGTMELIALADSEDAVPGNEFELSFSVKDPSGTRTLKQNGVLGKMPLECKLSGIDVSEANREGATYHAIARLSEARPEENSQKDGELGGITKACEIPVFGCKQAMDHIMYRIIMEKVGGKSGHMVICLQGKLSVKTSRGYKIEEVDRKNMSLEFSALGESPHRYLGKLTCRKGEIRLAPWRFKGEDLQEAMYFVLKTKFRIKNSEGKTRIIPISYNSRSSTFYE